MVPGPGEWRIVASIETLEVGNGYFEAIVQYQDCTTRHDFMVCSNNPRIRWSELGPAAPVSLNSEYTHSKRDIREHYPDP